jgi:predicted regulator of Ras-like GTPase activity (Roadblock/LC7/MglB family)
MGPTTVTTAPARSNGTSNDIEVPLASVLANMSMELRAKLIASPAVGATLRLPAEMVISQLAFGAVMVPFGELRRLASGLFVNAASELDNQPVSLPLQEILPRINPALLARRTARHVEVSEEIAGPFAERGRGFSFTTQPLKGPAAPAPVAPASTVTPPAGEPLAPEPAASLVPPIAVRQTTPPPAVPPLAQRSITPAGSPLSPTPSSANGSGSIPISPLSPRSAMPSSFGPIGGNGHGNGNHSNGHTLPPTPGLRTGPLNGNGHAEATIPLGIAPVPAIPGTPADSQVTISVKLGELSENWPVGLKGEIASLSLAGAPIILGAALILPGLKRGRIVMTWRQLRLLAQPGLAPSPNDNLELELPLKIVAPRFLAAQRNPSRPQAKASVSGEIPDLFFGFPQPGAGPAQIAPAVPVVPPAPAVAASNVPLVPPLPRSSEPQPLDTNYFTAADKAGVTALEEAAVRKGAAPQTDFFNRQAHPKEVVARAAGLNGVAGAIVAMQDGLRVASQVPPDLNSDALAAFLPQIFERLNQSTRELRMGALNNLNFTVGNVPWKIFRVNAVYFAAFGRAGEQLPSAQLANLAAELDRKKA